MEAELKIIKLPHHLYEKVINYVNNSKSPYSPNYRVLSVREKNISEGEDLFYDIAININSPEDMRGKRIPHPEEKKLLLKKVQGLVELIFS